MTAPNRTTLWGRVLVDELAASGLSAACIAPGSRSTPLTVALAEHPDVETFSILDERSAAFFAVGRGRQTGEPTAVVCTSGTAAANFHPAVIEASQSRVPLLALTADRPPELHDSGANQTIDQKRLYGDAVRLYRTLPEPEPIPRKLRSLRVTASRAVRATTGRNPGPVHLNVPARKPLEPTESPGDVPDNLADRAPEAVTGRDGAFVTDHATTTAAPGSASPVQDGLAEIATAVAAAERGLLVAGPLNPGTTDTAPLAELAATIGFPLLADPLSGLRFGDHVVAAPVCGGYDSYLDAEGWPDPELVIRFGFSPTSKVLRQYLRDAGARQVVVDPAGDWPEAEFTATDRVTADPAEFARTLLTQVDGSDDEPRTVAWCERFERAEATYWETVTNGREPFFEGSIARTVLEDAPDQSTVFVSNSMPVRDCDRFGRPREADVTVMGNRGASGIDGITSSGLGAGSATDDPLVVLLGDLAYYHDMNGLLSVTRCDIDATIVVVNNDGGGIFHLLPIEEFDPPFTEQFRTPHGLDFEPTAELYDLEYRRVTGESAFREAYTDSLDCDGTQVIEVVIDGEESHRYRETLHDRACDAVAEGLRD
jgi:2-succinyl-5-enolpyruvyl-6-hydroxy-3-cyclohexene-1-carboxylate synthase